MEKKMQQAETKAPVRITFAAGGWVILLSIVLMAALAWRVLSPALSRHSEMRGDGRDLASYGFNLQPCLVPQNALIPAVPADRFEVLDSPQVLAGSAIEAYNKEQREKFHRKFLVPGDRVIGLSLNGESRAYPLNVLAWHEVSNDTLGGVPLAVTFSPLCDSAVAFDRRIGSAVLDFGVSGLLYNSNLVLYDRQPGHTGESLWSQLQFKAIAGPQAAAGATLQLLPLEVTQWDDWFARHPDTTVVQGLAEYGDRYNANPYGDYLQLAKLRFPVAPEAPADKLAAFDRVLAIQGEDGWSVYPVSLIQLHAGQGEPWRDGSLDFHYTPESPAMDPASAYITTASGALAPPSVQCLWFAWYAMHPELQPAPLP